MNTVPQSSPRYALWIILAISAVWALYVFGSYYSSCRSNAFGQIVCFLFALFVGFLDILLFILGTIGKLIVLILP